VKVQSTVERLLYTTEEAAEALGVGRCKVYELMGAGLLYSVKIGRSRRIPVDALRRYVAGLTGELV
jgi:excisionase family DNA binding protein